MGLGEVAGWIALALTAFLGGAVFIQSRRLARVERRLRSLGKGAVGATDGAALVDVVASQGAKLDAARAEVEKIQSAVKTLDVSVARTVQYIGLVRYNPFHETGGDQSFALALLDRFGNGVVVSSLHTRTATRFYAKPVKRGASPLSLSDEEAQAIKQAMDGAHTKAQEKALT
jgi:hypothetical protein